MTLRDREGKLKFVFCDDGRVKKPEKERWGMKMAMIWMIQADI